MKPFFKWSGGKSRELKFISAYVPEYQNYYEPFCGAASVWLHLCPSGMSYINDKYTDVANFFQVLKEKPSRLVERLNELSADYNSTDKSSKEKMEAAARKFYYDFRNSDPPAAFDKAVKFYMLRQLSFSGMLRFNASGGYNVPFGWYKKMKTIPKLDNTFLSMLDRTEITNLNWSSSVQNSTKHDFVFLDPPYTRTFQKYSPDGAFGEKEHIELAEWFHSKQAQAMIVLNETTFTKGLYDDFIIKTYDFGYSVRFRDRQTTEANQARHFIAVNFKDESKFSR